MTFDEIFCLLWGADQVMQIEVGKAIFLVACVHASDFQLRVIDEEGMDGIRCPLVWSEPGLNDQKSIGV